MCVVSLRLLAFSCRLLSRARYLGVTRYPEVLGDDLGEVETVRLSNDFEQLPWVADSEAERFVEALVCLAGIPFHRCEVLFDPIGTLVGPDQSPCDHLGSAA